MNGSGRREGGGGRWKHLKERLKLTGMSCCSRGIWGLGAASSNMTVRDEDEEEQDLPIQEHIINVGQIQADNESNHGCINTVPPVSTGINLATALAAERYYRATQDWEGGIINPNIENPTESNSSVAIGMPLGVSLMRLLEGEGVDLEREEEDDDDEEEREEEEKESENEKGMGNDIVCCVCMERKKGAAFIPCGHTFCRVCSRELWLNRGICPLCNRLILEVLDIF